MAPSLVDFTQPDEPPSHISSKGGVVTRTRETKDETSDQLPEGHKQNYPSKDGRNTYTLSSELSSQIPNPSLQVTASHTIKLTPAAIHAPSPGEVLVHIKATGLCGSDIHFWRSGCIGPLTVEGDCILGHEAAGIIVDVGEGVTHLRPGDRVAIEPGVACETNCFLCRSGQYNLCEDVRFAGVYPHPGTLQRLKCHPARWVHPLPDQLTYAQGALLEPLSVVMRALETCRISLGHPILIHGAGPIGLIALACARASGAHPIVITDLEPKRLDFARRFVPGCQTYLIQRQLDAWANADGIRGLFGVAKRDEETGTSENEALAPATVLECTGVESSVVTAAYACRRAGVVVVVGVGKSIMNNLPFMHLSLAEIQLRFTNRYRDTWPAGIRALCGGILNLDALVTHTFPLERAVEAMELAGDVSRGSIKVQVVDDDVDVLPRRDA
ncbi:hypothetical protein LTR46_006665 [Exophiala xenobiotica]|nr:hypothetical protein LTR46_006665 [Exophiala xenobiotica]